MRKRVSRPARFAAVDNGAVDSLPSILSIGLLTRLIRAKDGDPVTVESLTQEYAEGEAALSRAMRTLVEAGLVVKFKVQRARSAELIDEETGEAVTRRGGSWFTEFSVDSIPHTLEDVAAMLEEILDGGNVKAMRVEPVRLDPRKQGSQAQRPTPQNAGVGPTCGNTSSGGLGGEMKPRDDGPRPAPAFPGAGRPGPGGPGAGRPGPGQAGALIRKKTVYRDSLSGDVPEQPSAGADLEVVTEERENPAPRNSTPTAAPAAAADTPPESLVAALCEAWASGADIPRTPTTIARQIGAQALDLAAAYPNPVQQQAIAQFAGEHRWQDLERAAMHPDCALLIHAATKPAAAPSTNRAMAADCGDCDQYGWLLTDDDDAARKCPHLTLQPNQQAA